MARSDHRVFRRFTFPAVSTIAGGSPFLVAPEPHAPAPPARAPDTKWVARLHISQLTPALFDTRFRVPGVPLIIEGALDLPAFEWRLQPFVESFASSEVTYLCRIHGSDAFATSPSKWTGKSHARHVVPTTPSKFAQTITDGIAAREDCYVQADIRGTSAGDALDKGPLRRIAAATGLQVHRQYGPVVNMWWGPSGHKEPLHMDATDGTLCQLYGRKHIVLFPAHCWRDLYPFPATETGMSWAFSQVVQASPDLGAFPRLAQALPHRLELVLEEGEVLFLPAGVAHEISGERLLRDGSPAEHVLSVNRFWRTDPNRVRPHIPEDARRMYDATLATYE